MGGGHHHDHPGHHRGHAHSLPGRGSAALRHRKRLLVVLALVATYMVAEVIGGIWANSLALLADAGHMLSDVGAIGLSLFAIWIGQRPATPQHTYGYFRTEILAALVNGAALIAISVFIFFEAARRLMDPQPVAGATVMLVAAGGLVVNSAGLALLHRGKDESLNVRGAWLHILTDLLGTLGVLTSGALVWALGWYWADPAVSVVIGVLVVYGAWHIVRESVGILLEGTPGHIDLHAVEEAMRDVAGVADVHDLHVWTITSGMEAMSGHVVVPPEVLRADGGAAVLREVRTLLHDRFGIDHLTVQLEPPDFPERETHF